VAIEFDHQIQLGRTRQQAIQVLKANAKLPKVLLNNLENKVAPPKELVRSLTVSELLCGMLLMDNVFTKDGILLVPQGQRITRIMLFHLKNYADQEGIREPIQVMIGHQPTTM